MLTGWDMHKDRQLTNTLYQHRLKFSMRPEAVIETFLIFNALAEPRLRSSHRAPARC